MSELFFEPGAFPEFCSGFADEMELQGREHLAGLAHARREIGMVERRQTVGDPRTRLAVMRRKPPFANC